MSGGRTLRFYEDNSEAKASVPSLWPCSANYLSRNFAGTGRSAVPGSRKASIGS
jgi:hypothetical protein